jgi:hypothetical protein
MNTNDTQTVIEVPCKGENCQECHDDWGFLELPLSLLALGVAFYLIGKALDKVL